MQGLFYDNVAGSLQRKYDSAMNAIVKMLSSLLTQLNPASQVTKRAQELANAASEAAVGMSSYLPWNWFTELDNAQFRQWVLANPHVRPHIMAIEKIEEEDEEEETNNTLHLKF